MKKILIGVGVVIVLLIAAALVIPFLIPFDTYKAQIAEQVKAATGRDLRIDGPVRLSIIPSLSLDVNKVGFSNAPGGQAKEMLTLDKLQLALKLFPLLSGEVAVDKFALIEPVIALEVDKNGKPNWVFDTPAAPKDQAKPKEAAKGGGASALQQLRLDDIEIKNGTLTYLDQKAGTKETISGLNLKLALPSLDEPLKANGDLTWKSKKIALTLNVAKPRALMDGQTSGVGAKVQAETINFDYQGEVTASTPAKVGGTIDLNIPSIRNLAAWTGNPIQMQGEGLGPLAIKGKLAMAGPKIGFTDASVAIDAIKAKGGVTVDTGGARPRIDAKLDVDQLNLNPYLPPEQAKGAGGGASAPAAKAAPSGWSDEPIQLAGLKAVDADFNLSVGGIQVRQIKIGKGVVVAKLKDGRLQADLTQLDLYQGNGQGKVVLDGTRADSAGLELVFNLAKIQAEPLLRDAASFERLSGAGAFDLAVTGRGKSQRDLINALNGKGKIEFRDGAIKGINLAAMVRNAASAFTGGGAAEKTDFSELGGTFTITNGILKNTDLAMKSPLLRVEGAGTVDLPKRTVDYKVTPRAVASLEGQGGGNAAGIMVPVLVQGPWDNLSYKPDLAGLIQQNLADPSKLLEGAKDIKNLPGALIPGVGGQKPAAGGATTQQPTAPSKPTDAIKGLFGR